ncbi:AgmX/PglI C-terminal domain-containing protein [Sorangium sp. So ce1036]|uniref:AgmX/PglI C-terminal domain-containing protein n=1 Tax=Sorangium sp. So ce1036 TaxID=3133328 RepID=UPI003EFC1446
MRQLLLGLFVMSLASASTGCSFAVRSPEMYRDDTAALLETRNEQIKACYDAELARNPGAQGKVTVEFLVLEDSGRITQVVVDPAGTTASEEVANCVVSSIDGLVLTPPDEKKGKAKFVWEFTVGAPKVASAS